MKTIIITIASLLTSGVIFSQNNSEEIQYPYTVSSNNQINNTEQPKKTIADIDKELEAIDSKIQYVKSHPEELEIAVKESWFEQMETYKKTLEKEKATLQK
jgi:hypothetical protein